LNDNEGGVIGGLVFVGGIAAFIFFIVRRKKRKNDKKRKNEQQLNENNSMIQQKRKETHVIESEMRTITSFDERNTNTTTLSTYQPGIHSSKINKQINKHILSSSQTFDI
jgi:hypothetical protein